jgi:predicted GNAT family acetyltransferase
MIDAPSIWRIIGPTIRAGETYALDHNMSEADALAHWMSADRETFVAEQDGEIVGTYYMRANQAGNGKHICNCGYITSAAATGRGVARAMCEHSLDHARWSGYRGMQFNFVVSSNTRAVAALGVAWLRNRRASATSVPASDTGIYRRAGDVPCSLTIGSRNFIGMPMRARLLTGSAPRKGGRRATLSWLLSKLLSGNADRCRNSARDCLITVAAPPVKRSATHWLRAPALSVWSPIPPAARRTRETENTTQEKR